MLGAIAGDIIGSVFEFNNRKTTDFELFSPGSNFTDDTVLTVAIADCLINRRDFAPALKQYARSYPGRGYGGRFSAWIASPGLAPYDSFGNGSAMRVSPVGYVCKNLEETLLLAKSTSEVTHDHPEGIKGAQAVAAAVFMALDGAPKDEIKKYVARQFGYGLDRTLAEIRPGYRFDETCPGSVPEAITAFLESDGFEDAVRKAVSIGGDSDTIACIAGAIAEAYYGGVPEEIARECRRILDPPLLKTVDEFYAKFGRRRAEKSGK